ncbi:MAG: hypothetical protein EOP06_27025, partial [Proteobacteria bacterium]
MTELQRVTAISEQFMRSVIAEAQPHLDSEQVEDLIESTVMWGPINGFKISDWLTRLLEVCNAPADTGNGHFFILLADITSGRLREFVETQRDAMASMLDNPEYFGRHGMKAADI